MRYYGAYATRRRVWWRRRGVVLVPAPERQSISAEPAADWPALRVAAESDPHIDVDDQLHTLESWVATLRQRLEPGWNNLQKLAWLSSFVFKELGFRGDAKDYLKGAYLKANDDEGALAAVDRLLLLRPDDLDELRDRGLLLYRLRRFGPAFDALAGYLRRRPDAADRESVEGHVANLWHLVASLN